MSVRDDRNTPSPATRVVLLAARSRNSSRGRESERTFSRCTRRPRRQVSMPIKTAAAMNKGSQPPSGIFSELAVKKV